MMLTRIRQFWTDKPVAALLLIALLPRLGAAVFSKGYAMHDDHFGPIEQPFIVMNYSTYWTDRTTPHGHSIVYPSMHYALFEGLQTLGLRDPQTTMLIVRLLHALYSLLIVYYGYKIVEYLADRDTARKAGLLLALFWAFSFLSVRNLIEVVCIPPLMAGSYYALRAEDRSRNALFAGLCLGLAFIFRYQTLIFSGTLGLVFLFTRRYRLGILLAAGFLLITTVVQGSVDIFAWGYPFASFIEYVHYNLLHGQDYTTGPWYNYLLLITGTLIPPMSFLLLFGFLRKWKKTMLVWIPVVVFIVLHSWFPNKQERFMFSVIPLILILGVVGWEEFARQSRFWIRHATSLRVLWIWFWVVNVALLILFTTYYGKKSRVEAMYALNGKPVTALLLIGGHVGVSQPPFFYVGKYPVPYCEINNEQELSLRKSEIAVSTVLPNYAVVFGDEDLEGRLEHVGSVLGYKFSLIKRTEPSLLDYVFYRLNPSHNKNETTIVYEIAPR